jgi:hypothetical protein
VTQGRSQCTYFAPMPDRERTRSVVRLLGVHPVGLLGMIAEEFAEVIKSNWCQGLLNAIPQR